MENYVNAKGRIFENQTAEDLLVLNGDDPLVCQLGEKAVSQKPYSVIENRRLWCLFKW